MNKYLTEIENKLDLYFGKKAPTMPESIKELIVKYSPYVIIIALVLSLPALLVAFGLGSFFAPVAYVSGVKNVFNFSYLAIFSLASLVLEVMALPGLFKRTKKSWQFMFYATLVSLLGDLVGLSLINLIISALISFYILFQIKSYYKN